MRVSIVTGHHVPPDARAYAEAKLRRLEHYAHLEEVSLTVERETALLPEASAGSPTARAGSGPTPSRPDPEPPGPEPPRSWVSPGGLRPRDGPPLPGCELHASRRVGPAGWLVRSSSARSRQARSER